MLDDRVKGERSGPQGRALRLGLVAAPVAKLGNVQRVKSISPPSYIPLGRADQLLWMVFDDVDDDEGATRALQREDPCLIGVKLEEFCRHLIDATASQPMRRERRGTLSSAVETLAAPASRGPLDDRRSRRACERRNRTRLDRRHPVGE